MFNCPECSLPLRLSENYKKKKGFSSLLNIHCYCGYLHQFFTSKPAEKGFDINRRAVYTIRSLGYGYTGLEKHATMMNMPKPMTINSYNKISCVAKAVAFDSMSDAAKEIRTSKGIPENYTETIVDTGVSCDGTWQRRRFSSHNGVFTTISIDTGKVLDVESMSKSR